MTENLKSFLLKEEFAKASDEVKVHQTFDSFVVFSINNYSTRYTATFTKTGRFKAHSVRLNR